MTTEPRIQWRWGALAALAMTGIALYPQINLWLARGAQWLRWLREWRWP